MAALANGQRARWKAGSASNNAAMLIVDANNVLHAAGDGRSPDGVVRLMEAVLRSRYASREVVLVCDGTASSRRMTPGAQAVLTRLLAERSGARVVYAGPEREADDVIEEMIAARKDGRGTLVVSSDARLALAAFRAGAASIAAAEFLGQLEKDRAKVASRRGVVEEGLDAGSVAWWLQYFGLGGEVQKRTAPARARRETHDDGAPPPAAPRKAKTTAKTAEDWLAEARRMWPGVSEAELDMERILKEHAPKAARRRKRKDG